MPDLGIVNNFPRLILLSPFHGLISRHFLVLSFQGRKTGKRYDLPLAYVRRDGEVIMTTFQSTGGFAASHRPVAR